MSRKAVLFVVYDFPPEGARGTKRTLKFVRYLPQNGWEAVVLTVRASPNQISEDKSLFDELPNGLPVHRARTLENLFHRPVKRSDSIQRAEPSREREAARTSLSATVRELLRRLYKGVGGLVRVPDSRVLWLPFAVIKGLRIVRQHECSVIYTSGPSHTNHLVGALLSRMTGLPLVIDFRDAWVGNPAGEDGNRWNKAANGSVERFCVKTASTVVCTTDGIRQDFERRYADLPHKYLTITNGFDLNDFPKAKAQLSDAKGECFTMVHAGTLGGERSPKEFLQSVGELVREHPGVKSRLRIVFVGQSSKFTDGRTIEDYVREYECGEVVELAGYVSRRESLEYMLRANALLLIIGRVPKEGAYVYGISGKLYDYAAARKPVLTVSEPGSTAELAARLQLGPVVSPDDIEAVKSAIFAMWEEDQAGRSIYSPNEELLMSFEFGSLTHRLADCFSKVCAAPGGRAVDADQVRRSEQALSGEIDTRRQLVGHG